MNATINNNNNFFDFDHADFDCRTPVAWINND